MKIIRYRDALGQVGWAALEISGGARRIEGNIFGSFEVTDELANVVKLLAPVAPPNIYGIGLNYRPHAEETSAKIPEYPVVFMKATSAVQNPGDPIVLPTFLRSDSVDYECELAVVIGTLCKNVSREDALSHVIGYACANDVSARDWQKEKGGSQWCRGKTFDTFCPLGPWLVTADEVPNPNALAIGTRLNGQIMQEANTSEMIFDVPALIAFLSGSTTLLPGTVILTGTPSGVGMARKPPVWLEEGDEVEVEIEGLGKLRNRVVK